MNNSKPLWQSKTVILALLQGLSGVLLAITQSSPTLGYLMIVKSVCDILIRWYTDQPITI